MSCQRLLDEVRAVMRKLHYSIHTERCYCDWIKRFVLFHRFESREALLAAGCVEVEAFLTGDRDMLIDGLLMVYAFDHGGPTISYQQARGLVDDLLSQPHEQEWANRFKERRPSWAHVLDRPNERE